MVTSAWAHYFLKMYLKVEKETCMMHKYMCVCVCSNIGGFLFSHF